MGTDSDEQKPDPAATPSQPAAKPQADGGKAADVKSGKAGKIRRKSGPPPWVVWSMMGIILIFFGVMATLQIKYWLKDKAQRKEKEETNISKETKDIISRANEIVDAALKSKAPTAERKALLEAARAEMPKVREALDRFAAEANNHKNWTPELIDYQMQIFHVPDLFAKVKMINDELAKIAMDNPSSETPPGGANKPPAPAVVEPGPAAPPTADPKLPAPGPAAVEPGPADPPTAEPKPTEPAVIEPKQPTAAP
jgi:hypothetical protein